MHKVRQLKNERHHVTSVLSKGDNILSKENEEETVKVERQLSTIEKTNSDYKQVSNNRESYLHRTRQLKNKSHCVLPAFSKYVDISIQEDVEEEVIYSEGESFDGCIYPNNTWDSEDSMYEEEYKVSVWI